MKEEIRIHLNDPRQMERMYRANRAPFRQAFTAIYPELKGNSIADFWNERLNYETEDISWGSRGEILLIAIAAIVAGIIAKLPAFIPVSEDFFYPRNMGFIIFPALMAYFAWKNKLSAGKIAFIAGASAAALVFINSLPPGNTSDTLILSCVHLALLLWFLLGFAFVGTIDNDVEKRLGYLKFNGDLLVMSALIIIAGGILSGITIGLFSLIGLHIEQFYFENIVVFGLPAVPIAGSFLIQANPQLVGKVSPVIAKIFSPLVLVMLLIYLGAMAFSGRNPFNDREFLLIFNALLVGVMAIIFFSVAESSRSTKGQAEVWVLLLLSVVTIIVNGVALSAILFRISEWGITPNRAAVLGSNVLMLVNLLWVMAQLFKVSAKKGDITGVARAIVTYLPVYAVWALIVTFLFPFLFGFK